ncbi:MAG: response regulator transcription factor [Holophagaceae bacterium]|nr:response regulator transcription factor [Holophagaceae bacterium]
MRPVSAIPRTKGGLVAGAAVDQAERCRRGRIVLIDDDAEILAAVTSLLELEGYLCETYASALDYLGQLGAPRRCPPGPCCVLLDVMMPDLDGLEAQRRLAGLDDTPLLLMSGASGVQEAVTAFRAGALDFLIKPIEAETLLEAVEKALAVSRARQATRARTQDQSRRLAALTPREHDVAVRVARGKLNRVIGEELGLALRTVKLYRQRCLEKLEASSTADLIRILQEEDP